MKTLLAIRHAKSSWEAPGMDDFDRPLNDRGIQAAPEMARRLIKKNIAVDLMISSPAKRALETALAFAEEMNYDRDKILFVESLYLAGVPAILAAITRASDDAASMAVFCHNPGITEFANTLTDIRIDNIPTAGIFAVEAACESWNDFYVAKKNFLFFDYPKALKG